MIRWLVVMHGMDFTAGGSRQVGSLLACSLPRCPACDTDGAGYAINLTTLLVPLSLLLHGDRAALRR
jgi:hypothetical protein